MQLTPPFEQQGQLLRKTAHWPFLMT